MVPVLKTGGRKARGFESHSLRQYGQLTEWLKVPAWKVGSRQNRLVGSNPALSAKYMGSVAKLVDAPDCGSGVRKDVRVQIPSLPPIIMRL